MTDEEQLEIINRNTSTLLLHAIGLQSEEVRQQIRDNPGITGRIEGESVEYYAGDVLLATVDRETLADPDFDVNSGQFVTAPDDISELLD
ncbi:hypothetical protein [Rhodococcus sp. P1Y]|uniref:hypothetical protein n=1 Tax=Rhodococcus sp. P1Y TaxID=1302308 RepID=UPI000EAF1D5B|nr:hypothetical protein [Rhodococcus sp. P1Y]AYJ48994.1 hypothetical protein D8W71_12335 [Rhodococcus sp. P1Y]